MEIRIDAINTLPKFDYKPVGGTDEAKQADWNGYMHQIAKTQPIKVMLTHFPKPLFYWGFQDPGDYECEKEVYILGLGRFWMDDHSKVQFDFLIFDDKTPVEQKDISCIRIENIIKYEPLHQIT